MMVEGVSMKFEPEAERKRTMMRNLINLMDRADENETHIYFSATRECVTNKCYLCEHEFTIGEHTRAFNFNSPRDIPNEIFLGAWCENCYLQFDLFSKTLHNVN